MASVAVVAFRCTSPAGDLKASTAGRAFLSAYAAAYHSAPDPLAIYGYEAMKLAIGTIAGLGARGDEKPRSATRCSRSRPATRRSAPTASSATANSTASSYGLYDVGANGAPAFLQELTP